MEAIDTLETKFVPITVQCLLRPWEPRWSIFKEEDLTFSWFQIYHRTSDVQPQTNQIDRFFRQDNRLADSYQMLREVEEDAVREATGNDVRLPIIIIVFRRDQNFDQRRYETQNYNKIAMVFVNNDGDPLFDRDIRVYPLNPENSNRQLININILSPNVGPMSYPRFFRLVKQVGSQIDNVIHIWVHN